MASESGGTGRSRMVPDLRILDDLGTSVTVGWPLNGRDVTSCFVPVPKVKFSVDAEASARLIFASPGSECERACACVADADVGLAGDWGRVGSVSGGRGNSAHRSISSEGEEPAWDAADAASSSSTISQDSTGSALELPELPRRSTDSRCLPFIEEKSRRDGMLPLRLRPGGRDLTV